MTVNVGDLVVIYENECLLTNALPLFKRTIGLVTHLVGGPEELILIKPYRSFVFFLGYFDRGRSVPARDFICCVRSEAQLAFKGV